MLKSIYKAVKNVGKFISLIFDIAKDLISDIVEMIELVGEYIVKIPDFFSWLPPELVAGFVAIFSIVVVYKIIGREG